MKPRLGWAADRLARPSSLGSLKGPSRLRCLKRPVPYRALEQRRRRRKSRMSPVLRVVTVFVIAAVAHTVAPARAEMSAEELAFQRALRGLLEQLPLRLDLQALVNQWY